MRRIDMWLAIKERSGKVKKELAEKPVLRPEAAYLWTLFCDIKRGCERVGYHDISAYCSLMRIKLSSWEIESLLDMELERCKHV